MGESLPILLGIIGALIFGRPRCSTRFLYILAAWCLAGGVMASIVNDEMATPWLAILADTAQISVAAGVTLVAQRVRRGEAPPLAEQLTAVLTATFERDHQQIVRNRTTNAPARRPPDGIISRRMLEHVQTRSLQLLAQLNAALPSDEPPISDLHDLTPTHLQLLASEQLRRYKPATARYHLHVLRKLMRALYEQGWVSAHPDEYLPRAGSAAPAPQTQPGAYTAAEIELLLPAVAARAGAEIALLCRVLLVSGLRPAEAARLRGADLDRDRGRITICRRKVGGMRQRVIDLAPVDPVGHAELAALLHTLPPGADFLWPGATRWLLGAPKQLAALCAELGLPSYGLEGLRASFAQGYAARRWERGAISSTICSELQVLLGLPVLRNTLRYVAYIGDEDDAELALGG